MDTKQTPHRYTNPNVELILCILFGWMGAHRFYTKKTGSAVLYLLTVGLCGIGWIADIVTIAIRFSKRKSVSNGINWDSSPDVYVFVAQKGKKYHNDSFCGGNRNLKRKPKQSAIAAGYTQCEHCRDYYLR